MTAYAFTYFEKKVFNFGKLSRASNTTKNYVGKVE